jgi:putative transposase
VGREDLRMTGMLKHRKPARAMADAGRWQLRTFCAQKMACVNGKAVVVDRSHPSTKTCSGCGHVKKRLPPKYRTHICQRCGLTLGSRCECRRHLRGEARRILAVASWRPSSVLAQARRKTARGQRKDQQA